MSFVCKYSKKKYIKFYYLRRPSMFKMAELFSANNVKLLNNVSKYLIQALNLRHNAQGNI